MSAAWSSARALLQLCDLVQAISGKGRMHVALLHRGDNLRKVSCDALRVPLLLHDAAYKLLRTLLPFCDGGD